MQRKIPQTICALAAAVLFLPAAAAQPSRPITLRQAVEIALEHNSDVLLAAVEIEKAAQSVEEQKAYFSPQVYVGSGLGYTDGIPQSVEGATPSVAQASGRYPFYDRSRKKRVAEAREMAAAGGHRAQATREDVAFRVASTYLDFERAARGVKLLRDRVDSLGQAAATVSARVDEGRALRLDLSRARLDVERAKVDLAAAESDLAMLEATLRSELRIDEGPRLEPLPSDNAEIELPPDAAAAGQRAVANSADLKALQSELLSKGYAREAAEGARYPKLDFVAQYALLARFNNYDEFFNRFQRHNTQVGLSFQVPIFPGKGIAAQVGRLTLEAREVEIRRDARRSQIGLASERLYREVDSGERDQKLARLELEFARESLDVILARFDEGRATLDEVERSRSQESAAWQLYYDAQYALRKARLALLHQTGELIAALRR